MKQFTFPFDTQEAKTIKQKLKRMGFETSPKQNRFTDMLDRRVEIDAGTGNIRIFLPETDIVDEQEQLEFIAGVIGLDINKV